MKSLLPFTIKPLEERRKKRKEIIFRTYLEVSFIIFNVENDSLKELHILIKIFGRNISFDCVLLTVSKTHVTSITQYQLVQTLDIIYADD
jgi:hypothetical protein